MGCNLSKAFGDKSSTSTKPHPPQSVTSTQKGANSDREPLQAVPMPAAPLPARAAVSVSASPVKRPQERKPITLVVNSTTLGGTGTTNTTTNPHLMPVYVTHSGGGNGGGYGSSGQRDGGNGGCGGSGDGGGGGGDGGGN